MPAPRYDASMNFILKVAAIVAVIAVAINYDPIQKIVMPERYWSSHIKHVSETVDFDRDMIIKINLELDDPTTPAGRRSELRDERSIWRNELAQDKRDLEQAYAASQQYQ